jgi:hypothetical protein
MFGSSWDRMVQGFGNRFEADGDGFLYRSSPKAAPIRVSAAERDAFIAQLKRQLPWLHWGLIGAIMLLVFGCTFLDLKFKMHTTGLAIYVGGSLIMALAIGATMYLWAAPQRALADRQPVGTPRSADEARRLAFKRMPWSNFLVGGAFLGVALFRVGATPHAFEGWGALWLVAIGAGFLLLAIQALRKWRAETPPPGSKPTVS